MTALNFDFPRVSPDLVAQAAQFPASILADVAGRRGTLHGRIAALHPSMRCAGPALTVEVRAGDNLMIHAAIAQAKPGDVLVIDGKADQTCALVGELMLTTCAKLKLGGIVLDAAVRDSAELVKLGFPVYSVGTNPNGPTKNVPGWVGRQISCGGVTVNPGDLIVADADGVTVLPREDVAGLIALAQKKVEAEQQRMKEIAAGQTTPSWLAKALQVAGVA
jgi:4-hydroxy-4-methyl-2-oxoglutarate aldolase